MSIYPVFGFLNVKYSKEITFGTKLKLIKKNFSKASSKGNSREDSRKGQSHIVWSEQGFFRTTAAGTSI